MQDADPDRNGVAEQFAPEAHPVAEEFIPGLAAPRVVIPQGAALEVAGELMAQEILYTARPTLFTGNTWRDFRLWQGCFPDLGSNGK